MTIILQLYGLSNIDRLTAAWSKILHFRWFGDIHWHSGCCSRRDATHTCLTRVSDRLRSRRTMTKTLLWFETAKTYNSDHESHANRNYLTVVTRTLSRLRWGWMSEPVADLIGLPSVGPRPGFRAVWDRWREPSTERSSADSSRVQRVRSLAWTSRLKKEVGQQRQVIFRMFYCGHCLIKGPETCPTQAGPLHVTL